MLMLALAIPGMWLAWRKRLGDIVLPLIYLGYMALYVPVLVLPRYRIVPVLILLLFASYSLAKAWELLRRSASTPAAGVNA